MDASADADQAATLYWNRAHHQTSDAIPDDYFWSGTDVAAAGLTKVLSFLVGSTAVIIDPDASADERFIAIASYAVPMVLGPALRFGFKAVAGTLLGPAELRAVGAGIESGTSSTGVIVHTVDATGEHAASPGVVTTVKNLLRTVKRDVDKCATCFAAGTLVATSHGEQAIQRLQVGDHILAEDPGTAKVDSEAVQAVIDDGVKATIALDLSDGSTIQVTSNHDFYVDGGPGLVDSGWLEAGQLQPGDMLRTASGTHVAVLRVRWNVGEAHVYTLTVATDHTFFVGSARVLVHNAGPCRVAGSELNHQNAAIGEYRGYQYATKDLGQIGIKAPGSVTAQGPDFITYNPDSRFRSIEVWDAKYRGPGGSYPRILDPVKLAKWMPTVREAVDALPVGPLRAAALDALNSGRVNGRIFKWPQ